ncbi:unnamed protein product [Didymodactylos carnosus]|uniref:G-protein coupled receptors family 1 profile domain-containing protein n=1 Tax=Didymodactylos carnosus TaxID=1234261 RepID=A0A814EPI6_9BILA|nr:unnamed protein product [Didymodactylos carnosus]CAF3745213.1 unnamed protein product [Didymodactylos carnosus]
MSIIISTNSTVEIVSRYIIKLNTISNRMNIYVNLLFLIFGNIGNLLKIFFFLQKPLRLCSCSVYIIAATITYFFLLNNIPVTRFLANIQSSSNTTKSISQINIGWYDSRIVLLHIDNIPMSIISPALYCKLRMYIQMLSTNLALNFVLLASINRYCLSSRVEKIRKYGQIYLQYRLILFTTIAWSLLSLHHFFNSNIEMINQRSTCLPKYLKYFIILSITYTVIMPMLMITFGLLTLSNVRNITKNKNLLQKHCLNQRIEYQLTWMILLEILLTVLGCLPHSLYAFYAIITRNQSKTIEQITFENMIDQISRMFGYIECSFGFYIYIFSLSTLRKRFINLLKTKLTCSIFTDHHHRNNITIKYLRRTLIVR